ncbi:two-component system, OmpR family, phosphate regulon sensor histidine kinase PhoR [Solimonas aquatica]|uniref:Phosphate regulon sensor protein PhoR n=1 Tax=Solimonas aquatica TaxID=489703 RepID=A0A1H9IER8_9GAMM|nr:phosphate regulon sensor histidine kinase PhoR [Solimonas aquatica]SEQ73044.1 two-component system, OmpR family, phosphate regulon sensor histidine kinase PhoR [Solimonas aquatica]
MQAPQQDIPSPESPAEALPEDFPSRTTFWRGAARMALTAGSGAALGAIVHHPAFGAALALSAHGLAQLRQLVRLRAWLHRPKRHPLPDSAGLWGEAFDLLLEMQRKNRKRKRKLSLMLAEFQASTAALPDGAVVLGERGEISWFNAAAQKLLGLRSPQDLGIRIPNLIRHPSFTDFFEQGDFERETEAPSPANRNRLLSLRIIPYGNEQKLLIVRDVSERRQLEAARRDFVANASHELRTPLTVLRGYLDLMEMDAQGSGPLNAWRTPVAEMRAQALRMEALVNDMLKLARLESDRTRNDERLQVPALIRRAIEEAKAVSKAQHRFEARIDDNLLLKGGENELHSIIINLLTNAVRYTPAGGVIRVSWERSVEGARFAVADTGIGIAQEDIPRLTERFYRVDVGRSRASGGTGLGLSIVKHALEGFDAELSIESELGVGSTFRCSFPHHRVEQLVNKAEPALK